MNVISNNRIKTTFDVIVSPLNKNSEEQRSKLNKEKKACASSSLWKSISIIFLWPFGHFTQ